MKIGTGLQCVVKRGIILKVWHNFRYKRMCEDTKCVVFILRALVTKMKLYLVYLNCILIDGNNYCITSMIFYVSTCKLLFMNLFSCTCKSSLSFIHSSTKVHRIDFLSHTGLKIAIEIGYWIIDTALHYPFAYTCRRLCHRSGDK